MLKFETVGLKEYLFLVAAGLQELRQNALLKETRILSHRELALLKYMDLGNWFLAMVSLSLMKMILYLMAQEVDLGLWNQTNTNYYAIAYTESNFNGEATFLKTGETDLHEPCASVKTSIQAAKLGWVGTTGYQKCINGKHLTLSNEFDRIDVSMAHVRCASIGSKVIRGN